LFYKENVNKIKSFYTITIIFIIHINDIIKIKKKKKDVPLFSIRVSYAEVIAISAKKPRNFLSMKNVQKGFFFFFFFLGRDTLQKVII